MLFLFILIVSQIAFFSRSASATPPLSFPLTKVDFRTAASRGSYDTASTLKRQDLTNVPVTNLNYFQYVMYVGVGVPPTYYSLVVDTGSSITFVGTGKPYNRTSTSIATGQNLEVTYDLGYLAGPEYSDTITLSPDLVITNQSIGDAVTYTDWPGVDGVLGIGPVDLTVGSSSPNITSLVPTVMDNAREQGLIQQQIMGVSFAPASTDNEPNGLITFGGINSSLFIGNITYVPITSTYPAAFSWGINITSCVYGETTIFSTSTAGIVDTGTSLVALADDFFATYMAAIPGSYYDNQTTFVIPSSSIANMQPLNFTIGSTVFTMDVAAQLIPVDQDSAWGDDPGVQYGTIGPLGHLSGQGLDFILGQKFLEIYYAVFDGENNRVGLAYTNHTPPLPEASGALSNTFGFYLLALLSMITQAYTLQFLS
ncbi:acid protease [Rhizopogon vinicolor AM-OR11-026]|uniref:Acid protease n=1 Tax=Rhizopogon vinicolor AM-OR11-026 TaxID=1314800 RepID=A0A1B7MQ51_9AGAM|nr:acid protease [Rhizopogon vinicolor AM-OR11-026]